ncbi:MAG: acyl-CoA dehydrogenase family protein [Dermatophilaceae bacterium]
MPGIETAGDIEPRQAWRSDAWVHEQVASLAGPIAGDVTASLEMAPQVNYLATHLGSSSWQTFSGLATLGCVDLSTARIMEPHIDATAILAQSGADLSGIDELTARSVWGVFAANGPGHHLVAEESASGWSLSGSKPWCSLAGRLSHALVTASDQGRQRLFAVHLDSTSSVTDESSWKARGLAEVVTGTLHFGNAPAVPIREAGWYLERAGFAWGGIGVAAVWFGGAAAVAGRLIEAARTREPDQVALMSIGICDRALTAGLESLMRAAAMIDRGGATGHQGALLAARVRSCIAHSVDEVLRTVGHALGPGPLAFDERHARRVADLTLYVRQHHAERDLARVGQLYMMTDEAP